MGERAGQTRWNPHTKATDNSQIRSDICVSIALPVSGKRVNPVAFIPQVVEGAGRVQAVQRAFDPRGMIWIAPTSVALWEPSLGSIAEWPNRHGLP